MCWILELCNTIWLCAVWLCICVSKYSDTTFSSISTSFFFFLIQFINLSDCLLLTVVWEFQRRWFCLFCFSRLLFVWFRCGCCVCVCVCFRSFAVIFFFCVYYYFSLLSFRALAIGRHSITCQNRSSYVMWCVLCIYSVCYLSMAHSTQHASARTASMSVWCCSVTARFSLSLSFWTSQFN